MTSQSAQLAVVVNQCTICGLSFSTSIQQHQTTDFHRMNKSGPKRMSIEEYAKKKRITLSQAKNQIALAIPRDIHVSPAHTKAKAKAFTSGNTHESQFVPKATVIKKTVQEHSHNNHHGLPGANKYAHRGPSSTPGKNHMFRSKKN